MDFRVDLIPSRERRAILLMGAALVAIIATSVMYLHPAVTEAPALAKAPVTTNVLPKRVVILNPGTDVYFTWRLTVIGGSGGHRAS